MIRTYSEMIRLPTFEQRFAYLKLGGSVGAATFGFERYLNQEFYRSQAWRTARRDVIARDYGCDLGFEGHEIFDKVYVHHMNPMRPDDIAKGNRDILDPEYLICVCLNTHNAIHYSDERLLPKPVVVRRPGDTTPWKKS